MSFFDRQGIPEALIRRMETDQNHVDVGGADKDNEENDEDSSTESIGNDGFEDDILTLRNYYFISR